jgi:hypothetical protein
VVRAGEVTWTLERVESSLKVYTNNVPLASQRIAFAKDGRHTTGERSQSLLRSAKDHVGKAGMQPKLRHRSSVIGCVSCVIDGVQLL